MKAVEAVSLKVTVKSEASKEMEPYLRPGVPPELKISMPEKEEAAPPPSSRQENLPVDEDQLRVLVSAEQSDKGPVVDGSQKAEALT